MVRIETMRAPVDDVVELVHAIASTASATASSSLAGSKMMFDPTAMASMMTGGFPSWGAVLLVPACLGYRGTAASQSSSNSGSSSFSDFRAGRSVVSRARWVVMESRASGYESGGDSSRI